MTNLPTLHLLQSANFPALYNISFSAIIPAMDGQRSLTPARRKSITLAVIGVALMGLIQLHRLLTGNLHGLLAWTLPFAFWSLAYLTYRRYLQPAGEKHSH